MKKWMFKGVLTVALLFVVLLPSIIGAGVDVNITIPLPAIRIPAPPAMMVIPGTYVYFAPDVDADLFFYRGYWYRPYRGEWYFSAEYNGPWGRVALGSVPPALINLPPDYHDVRPGDERMSCHMVQRNWRRWEEDRYWDDYGIRDDNSMRHGGHGMGMGHMGH